MIFFSSCHCADIQYFLIRCNFMSLCRPRCRAVLRARQRGESLCPVLHPAGAQWDQQPSLHLAFQDKGNLSTQSHRLITSINASMTSSFCIYRLITDLASTWRTLLPWTNHRATSPVRGRCPMFPLVGPFCCHSLGAPSCSSCRCMCESILLSLALCPPGWGTDSEMLFGIVWHFGRKAFWPRWMSFLRSVWSSRQLAYLSIKNGNGVKLLSWSKSNKIEPSSLPCCMSFTSYKAIDTKDIYSFGGGVVPEYWSRLVPISCLVASKIVKY